MPYSWSYSPLSNVEGTVEKNEVGHADIDDHKDVKKDEVKETLGKNPLLDLNELELRDGRFTIQVQQKK